MQQAPDVTQMLHRWSDGDEDARDKLLPLLYDQLKNMAHARLLGERPDHTLGTTALVHEAYVRLVDVDQMEWQGRTHFLAVASTTMRRVLVDYARRRRAQKRGGSAEDLTLKEGLIPDDKLDTMLDLDDSIERLSDGHERQARALEMYYFGGLTLEEIGETLETSAATAMRDLRFARAWLAREWGHD